MITFDNVILGADIPKICLPLTCETLDDIADQCQKIKKVPCDIAEFQADTFNGAINLSHLWNALMMLGMELVDTPLIFNCRSQGLLKMTVSAEEAEETYMDINRFAAKSGLINGLLIEDTHDTDDIQELINYTTDYGSIAILSHTLTSVPTYETVVKQLTDMIAFTVPAVQLTCTAVDTPADVLALLQGVSAVKAAYPNTALFVKAEGKSAAIVNISGETFGSDIAYATLEKGSVPGLLDASSLYETLTALH